ncbi:hypothetical protein AYI70_g12378 [Smittium culicis]|uniref:Uncharacterized protein n=1 Tax=Smittium culicis TaxID=133412 RepID=A0A1R1WXT7_9FUNG|nr:hypothetical protein AYI70_g12378 [Smittium culicis]
MANARNIDGAYKSECPLCKMKTSETVEHILWTAERKIIHAEPVAQQSSVFFNLAQVSGQAPGGGVKT